MGLRGILKRFQSSLKRFHEFLEDVSRASEEVLDSPEEVKLAVEEAEEDFEEVSGHSSVVFSCSMKGFRGVTTWMSKHAIGGSRGF